MTSPSVSISLAPDGSLQLHLPGSAGDRMIPLRETTSIKASETIRRVLEGLGREENGLGLEGAPTRAQVAHWERHQTFPDARCAFCMAEAQLNAMKKALDEDEPSKSSHRFDARYVERKLGDGVTVRRVKPKATQVQKARETRLAKLAKATTSARGSRELGF